MSVRHSIIETPLVESERQALRDHAARTDWALGVLIESALWNLERLEAQHAGAVEALRGIQRAALSAAGGDRERYREKTAEVIEITSRALGEQS